MQVIHMVVASLFMSWKKQPWECNGPIVRACICLIKLILQIKIIPLSHYFWSGGLHHLLVTPIVKFLCPRMDHILLLILWSIRNTQEVIQGPTASTWQDSENCSLQTISLGIQWPPTVWRQPPGPASSVSTQCPLLAQDTGKNKPVSAPVLQAHALLSA